MELEGKLIKTKKQWVIEIPSLSLTVQAPSRKGVLDLVKIAVKELVLSYFHADGEESIAISVKDYENGLIGIEMTDNKLLLALSLRRQREQSGLTIRQAAERLGSRSPNAYAQYERGKIRISLDKFERLLSAANPNRKSYLRIV